MGDAGEEGAKYLIRNNYDLKRNRFLPPVGCVRLACFLTHRVSVCLSLANLLFEHLEY